MALRNMNLSKLVPDDNNIIIKNKSLQKIISIIIINKNLINQIKKKNLKKQNYLR